MLVAAAGAVLLGMLGLTIDLGRAYVIRSELQAYSDAAAVAAAFELDGTSDGLARADAAAATGPTNLGAPANRYDFSTRAVSGIEATYSTTFSGAYESSAGATANSRFVRVTASANAPLYFMPILPGVGSSKVLGASSVAGQALEPSIGNGMAPFSPDAHNAADPNFGLTLGEYYTLKWPPPGQRDKPGNRCSGDVGFTPPNSSSSRGFINVGQGNGNSALYDAIVNNHFYKDQPYTIGSLIDWVPGNKNVRPAVSDRLNQDTDTTSVTYSSYTGNGRRLLAAPVNDGGDPARVVGFGAFFMPPDMCQDKNISPCCAEYVGPGLIHGSRKSPGSGAGAGVYRVRLFQ